MLSANRPRICSIAAIGFSALSAFATAGGGLGGEQELYERAISEAERSVAPEKSAKVRTEIEQTIEIWASHEEFGELRSRAAEICPQCDGIRLESGSLLRENYRFVWILLDDERSLVLTNVSTPKGFSERVLEDPAAARAREMMGVRVPGTFGSCPSDSLVADGSIQCFFLASSDRQEMHCVRGLLPKELASDQDVGGISRTNCRNLIGEFWDLAKGAGS